MTKQEAYRLGLYIFPVPPVRHVQWSEDSWIRYIDLCGRWTVTIIEKEISCE